MTEFRREVTMRGAFDKRSTDPKRDYGIHGMDLKFLLHGPKATMQFLVYTGLHLPHIHEELHRKRGPGDAWLSAPQGADIGYHADVPQYEGQTGMECEYRPGKRCYYDGTSLGADEFMPEFLAGGSEAVWTMLEHRYHSRFGEEPSP